MARLYLLKTSSLSTRSNWRVAREQLSYIRGASVTISSPHRATIYQLRTTNRKNLLDSSFKFRRVALVVSTLTCRNPRDKIAPAECCTFRSFFTYLKKTDAV